MRNSTSGIHGIGSRLLAGLLMFTLLIGLVPATIQTPASAASWAQQYMDKLLAWGVMRGDQAGNLNPDRPITRAEYLSMINRAYGYDDISKTPFTDVSSSAWYADDIGIAYRAGYFSGTSANTASPDSTLSREQATVILGRNLMLKAGLGETLDFTDSRSLSDWSRGIVKTAVEDGVVKGYPDGSFKPQNNITRGEVASLLVSAIGTPINKAGNYSLGSVYGNVTISSSGVTLRDTVIAGDLYLSGGVGLGYITLENVKVLGKIIASGAGESNKGDSSIILRNVTAPEMVVDSPANQFVTIRSEGDTNIDRTSVRTPSYLEDVTADTAGLKYIELDGEAGTTLELSGNIKEVMTITPGSLLKIARGTAKIVTVDEKAVGANVRVDPGAEIKTLNLDTATKVSGTGDVENVNVNAPGCIISMLPDKIVIRPGLTANINGQNMDSNTATESSAAPRLLSGYPRTVDIAPTSAGALFSTNKSGTVYWAVTSITDGSVGEADLISPPTYASKIIKSGNLKVAASSTEVTAKLTGLTSDGSYYLSAVMVDSRDQRSPVKVIAFSTPDDTVPNFAAGYPVMTKITNNSAQVTVMPTKSCKLYYALLPKNGTAPTPADFKAGAVTGNLGYGVMDVTKNVTHPFTVNDKLLKELETYDLFLWLTDTNGAKSSAVKKLSFTTVDRTPPAYNSRPTVNSVKETAVGLYVNLDEAATFYWAVVKEGAEYPKPLANSGTKPLLTSDTAKLQVMSGMNAIKSGKVTCAKDKDAVFSVSGLSAETAYDLYYVAQDKAGNYSESVEMLPIHTLDNKAPTLTQEFTHFSSENKNNPLADTSIRLVFSENIRDAASNAVFVELYNTSINAAKTEAEREAARNQLTALLRSNIQLWSYAANGTAAQVPERTTAAQVNWVIDYSNTTVKLDNGKLIITFPTDVKNPAKSALNLRSGSTYYFLVDGIADTSDTKNIMPRTQLEDFKTVFAQVNLATTASDSAPITVTGESGPQAVDMAFKLLPVSTSKVEDGVDWDMLIWCDTSVKFNLYRREYSATTTTPNDPWEKAGDSTIVIANGGESPVAVSLTSDLLEASFKALNTLDESKAYEYAIQFTELDGVADRNAWSNLVTMRVSIVAGSGRSLENLGNQIITPTVWADATDPKNSDSLVSIGVRSDFSIKKQFKDAQAPKFIQGHPKFSAGDTVADFTVMLDRPSTIYYVVAEENIVPPLNEHGVRVDWDQIPKGPTASDGGPATGDGVQPVQVLLSSPTMLDITSPKYGSVGVKSGHATYSAGAQTIHITGLDHNTKYHVYFVLKGASKYSEVKYYGFTTGDVTAPIITLKNQSPSVQVETSQDSVLDYALFSDQQLPGMIKGKMADYSTKTLPDLYKDYTVLKALTATTPTGYSVFDDYASDSAKEALAELIRTTSSSTGYQPSLWGTLNTISNRSTLENCTKGMTDTATYVFLAVAHHTQGTVDTFKAITSIHNPDSEAPVFKGVTTATDLTSMDPQWSSNPMGYSYSGTVTVEFNENLYQLTNVVDPSTGLRIAKPVFSAATDAAKAAGGVSIKDVIGGSASGLTKLNNTSTTPAKTITLAFTKVKHGDTIILFNDGTISDASGNDIAQHLTLTFDATAKSGLNNMLYPSFVASWGK